MCRMEATSRGDSFDYFIQVSLPLAFPEAVSVGGLKCLGGNGLPWETVSQTLVRRPLGD